MWSWAGRLTKRNTNPRIASTSTTATARTGHRIKVDGEIVGAIGLSGAPTVQNDIDCARAALALVSDAVPVE
jgi:uncharacterized protein GlcG (DUF336 family)